MVWGTEGISKQRTHATTAPVRIDDTHPETLAHNDTTLCTQNAHADIHRRRHSHRRTRNNIICSMRASTSSSSSCWSHCRAPGEAKCFGEEEGGDNARSPRLDDSDWLCPQRARAHNMQRNVDRSLTHFRKRRNAHTHNTRNIHTCSHAVRRDRVPTLSLSHSYNAKCAAHA